LTTRSKKFYFIGIGGVGMSGLAEILLNMGHHVCGSDREKSELTDYLEQKGAVIYQGHKAENVGRVDFVVYSSAIPKDNPEMVRARELNISLIRRAEMLGQLFNRKFGIGIAGTHGKTTTTSILGNILIEADLDPTIIVGGKLQNLMTNARLGESAYIIAEADEYDRSFLALLPRIAVITSLETDHLDIYDNLDDLKNTFTKFANQVSFDGTVIICADEPNLLKIKPQIRGKVISYGLSDSVDFQAKNIKYKEQSTSCTICFRGKVLGEISLNAPGEHNIKNALATIVAATELGIPFDIVKKGLAAFKGVGRRFEIIGRKNDILIVDDYAHHPTEVAATIQAASSGWKRRVIAVFQPHLYSRTKDFYQEFAAALSKAQLTVVTDVYPAREKSVPGVTGKLIADALQNEHLYVAEKTELATELYKIVRPRDLVLFMGAGDIWKSSRELVALCK